MEQPRTLAQLAQQFEAITLSLEEVRTAPAMETLPDDLRAFVSEEVDWVTLALGRARDAVARAVNGMNHQAARSRPAVVQGQPRPEWRPGPGNRGGRPCRT